jgi:putative transposase
MEFASEALPAHDIRDKIFDYMKYWSKRSELPCKDLLKWAKLSTSKYQTWLKRYGKINGHNGKIPRDWWLEEWEKQAILDFHDKHPLEGYRRFSRTQGVWTVRS